VDDAESAAYIAEGSDITEDNPDLAEVVVRTKKISRLVNLSNEQYRQDQTAEQLAQSVSRDIVRRADSSYIDDTTPVGLQAVPGTVPGGHIGSGDGLDALIDLIATLESNGAMPTHIVMDPSAGRNCASSRSPTPTTRACWAPESPTQP
jgi:HK97 family phage major capsid protein